MLALCLLGDNPAKFRYEIQIADDEQEEFAKFISENGLGCDPVTSRVSSINDPTADPSTSNGVDPIVQGGQ